MPLRLLAAVGIVCGGLACAPAPSPPSEPEPPASAPAVAARVQTPAATTYTCDQDRTLVVEYDAGGAMLEFDGRRRQMKQVPAASGAAYSDGELIWRTKARDGMLAREKDDGPVLTGCMAANGGGTGEASLPVDVLDVTWQWVEFVTPVEQVTPDAPERYAIWLTGEGRIEVRADCNRGSGGDTADRDRRIAFTPIALTRMACPPGSLSDRFVRELSRATSYFTRDGDLYLELPVDSGTLRFRRQP